jgi:hypothetical protein
VRSAETLDEIIARFCAEYGVTEVELSSKSRVRSHAKTRAEIALATIDTNAATLRLLPDTLVAVNRCFHVA